MKLLITVQGTQYEVDVQVLDENDTGSAPAATSAAPAAAAPAAAGAVQDVKSPIAGTVFDLRVKVGDTVKANDTLLVLEAMKMESNIAAPKAGVVKAIHVKVGDSVTHGQVLAQIG